MANRTNVVITILVLVIVVLVSVVGYTLFVKPAISGYATSAQNQGIEFAVGTIWQRAAQCQTVPLTLGNQTINLIAVRCLPQPAAQGIVPPTQ